MLLLDFDREFFAPLAQDRRYVEVGVYKGGWAQTIRKFSPQSISLVDSWAEPPSEDLVPQDSADANPRASLDRIFSGYYPNGMKAALQDAFEMVQTAFGNDPNCQIIKRSSKEGVLFFRDSSVDFLYLDANHRFDFVFADLERWQHKVAENGFILLNDCYVSPVGRQQHISVLEALSSFLKYHNWVPVAMINRSFTDILIARPPIAAYYRELVQKLAIANNVPFIELPNHLLHSAHHRYHIEIINGKQVHREYLSFGE